MKQFVLGVCLVMLSVDCSSEQNTEIDMQAEVTAAKTAVKALAGALQTELKDAMQSGGPVAAIGVCHTRALPITQNVGVEQGLALSRVSLNNRNPSNLPNDWQTAVLEDFEQQKAAGKDVGSIAWSETVSVDGVQEFRFMKAIPTAAVCLNCHGTNISPEVSQVLAGLYPQDLATGYREGDIRGAFVATRILSN